MMKPKTIGVLGGMGPAASAQTYQQLVQICQRTYHAHEDQEFPSMIIHSSPLSCLDHKGFSQENEEAICAELIQAIKKLEKAGAELVIIDCNTVHVFYDRIQKKTKAEIVNLVEATAEHLTKKWVRKIGLLASNTSRRLRLYEEVLEAKQIETIPVTAAEQRVIDKAIHAVMGGTQTHEHISAINVIIERLFDQGANAIVLGCTEISLLLKDRVDANRYIDSQWVAINKAVAKSYHQLV